MLPKWTSTVLPPTLVLFIVLLGGCKTTIDPFSDRFSYSIYGFLAPSQSTQFIRVRPLDEPLASNTARQLDVTVTLENRSTGATETLQDSVVVYRDANSQVVTHNYWTDTPIPPDTKYRVTVKDPDGTKVQATTTTLPKIDPNTDPSQGACNTLFTVELPGIKNKRQIRRVIVKFKNAFRISDESRKIFLHSATENLDARIAFKPAALLREKLPSVPENPCSILNSKQIIIRTSYFSEIPPRNSELLDPASPLELPIIENGRGFFSGLGQARASVEVDTSSDGPPRPGVGK